MAHTQTLHSPAANDAETQPELYLVAESDVDRSGGYIGVLFRYTKMPAGDGARRKELRGSHFLLSSSEACELRDRLDQALDGVGPPAYH